MPLTWRQCAHYVREVQELVWSLMRRLDELDAASTGWIEHDAAADRQLDAYGSVQRAIWNGSENGERPRNRTENPQMKSRLERVKMPKK